MTVRLLLALALATGPLAGQDSHSTVTGDLRLHQFKSRVFGHILTLRVLLPPGYDDAARRLQRYPVLYLNDGQNLFDPATATFGSREWKVDETVNSLIRGGGIEPLIVVGVDHAGKRRRAREYLPYVDTTLRPPEPNPRGRDYPRFLIEEVMPFINSAYRSRLETEATGLGGSSYGAAIALYTAVHRPGVFGRLLLESPSLYIDNRRLLDDVRNARALPERIYIGVGTEESSREDWNAEAVGDVRELERILRSGRRPAPELLVTVEEGGAHNEEAWARRLGPALRFLYGR